MFCNDLQFPQMMNVTQKKRYRDHAKNCEPG